MRKSRRRAGDSLNYSFTIESTCGKYITGIADVKTSDGTNYAILEGGLHQIVYYSSMAGMKVPFVEYIAGDKVASAASDNFRSFRLRLYSSACCLRAGC